MIFYNLCQISVPVIENHNLGLEFNPYLASFPSVNALCVLRTTTKISPLTFCANLGLIFYDITTVYLRVLVDLMYKSNSILS